MVMGRPRKELDWDELDKLCFMQCTAAEIAAWFECSIDTIENRIKEEFGVTFSEYHWTKAQNGKISLRRRMFQGAMEGDKTMMIWLSKQHLGMSEKIDKVVVNVKAPERMERLAKIQTEILELIQSDPKEKPEEGLLSLNEASDTPETEGPAD